MTEEPSISKGFRHVDDRGILDQPIKSTEGIKRFYITYNTKGVVRGYHGHLNENKMIYVARGLIKVIAFSMDTEKKGNVVPVKKFTFTLSDRDPDIVRIPNGYYHGYSTLSDESIVFIFSNKTLEESKEDDYRLDAFTFGHGIWESEAK